MKKQENFNIDFVGIGAPKSATTWLAQCLREHPEICFPKSAKELHFFNKRHIAYGNKAENKSYEVKGIKWFIKQFRHCKKNQKKGEFSVSYLYDIVACRRLKKHFPNIKIIVSLRNPIDMIYSGYLHGKRYGDYSKSFEEVIKEDSYLPEKGFYAKYLPNYLKNFKNIKIIFIEDIKKNPKKVIKEVYSFLGVDKNFTPPSIYSREINIRGEAKFPLLNKIITRTNHFVRKNNLNFILKIISIFHLENLFEKIRMKNVKKSKIEKMKPETRKKLVGFYKKDIEKLEKITKKNLSHWLR
jgi:hypothetical protein